MKHGFLFWVSLLFVSVVMALLLIPSNSLALSYQNIVDYVNQTTEYYSGNNRYPNIALNLTQPAIQTKIAEICENYGGMYVYYDSAGYVYWKFYNDNDGIITGGPNALYYQGNYAIITGIPTTNVVSNFTTGNTGAYVDTMDQCFRTTANKYNELRGMNFTNYQIVDSEPLTYVGQSGYSPMDKLEFHNAVENTAYNGSTYTYYYQGDFYSNNQIYLGYIDPNDSYYFEIRLRESNNNTIKGTCYVALNTSPYTFYSDGAITINNLYEINAIPRLLNYSTQYQLEITSYYGDGNTNLDEDIDWFIFLPQNAVISGDNITSLGSGDFTQQDNTNTIIGYLNDYAPPSGDIQAILDISGNILSGDLFKDIKMPQVDGMNRTTLFDLLYAIAGTIGEDGDAYFDFQLHGETPTRVYASQFRTPDGSLKTLISSFLVFFTFYFLLLQIRHALEMLSTANIKGTLEYVDASLDNMFYM